MNVLVKLNPGIGTDLGPDFLITSDVGEWSEIVDDTSLFAGVEVIVPDGANNIHIQSLGICLNILSIPIETTTTTSTTEGETTTTTTTVIIPEDSIDINCVTSSNTISYQTTPTYDGSGQVVHPDIYYNLYGWNGYKYWMVMTPYPNNNSDYENPSILVSNDGDTWIVPDGLTNPLQSKPIGGYNSDSDIFLGYDNKLWVVYRERIGFIDKFYVKSSEDGIIWSASIEILSVSTYYLSPSIILKDNEYVLYYIDKSTTNGVLKKRTCSTPDGVWSSETICSLSGLSVGRVMWHSNVIVYGEEYHMFLVTSNGTGNDESKLNFVKSLDGITWIAKETPILDISVSGWDNDLIYHAAPVLMYDSDSFYYDLWYSAMSSSNIWHIGRTLVNIECTTTTTTYVPVNLNENLLAVWELDEISGTNAEDIHGVYDGTITGATINQTGKINKCYLFDGNDNVSMGNVLNFERTTPFSVSFWAKTDTGGSMSVIGKMNHTSPYDGYSVLFNAGKLQFYLINAFTVNYINIFTNSTYNDNIWRHFVVTYAGDSNANNIKVYVDSSSVAITVAANNLSATTVTSVNFSLGSRNAANGVYYTGLLDQCAVWDKELNQNEVTTLYNSGNGLVYTSW